MPHLLELGKRIGQMIGGRLFYRFSAFFLGHGLGHGISLRVRTTDILEHSTLTQAEGQVATAFFSKPGEAALFSRPETARAFPAYRPSMAIKKPR
jgi:hypothetical protein